MLRYGEVFLKSDPVRREFIKTLVRNCREALRSEGLSPEERVTRGRIFFFGEPTAKVADVLSRVFGVVDVADCIVTPPDPEAVTEAAVARARESAGPGTTFAVRARREGDFGLTSQDLAARVGSAVLAACPGTTVDLNDPDYELHIELRHYGGVVYDRRIPAPGGLPLGTQGRVLALLSPGIDSPVAAWLMMKRGCEILALHVAYGNGAGAPTVPGTLRNLSILSGWCRGFPIRLVVVDAGPFWERAAGLKNPRFRCVLCKRFMLRVGSLLARREGIPALCTGDNLGQVASQTLANMVVIQNASSLPVFRPLIAFDKQEIVTLARKIGTFDERPGDLSCPYVPKVPATTSREEEIRNLEEALETGALLPGILAHAREYTALNGEVTLTGPYPD
jgi:thiamine biosynthesis protein ThiI